MNTQPADQLAVAKSLLTIRQGILFDQERGTMREAAITAITIDRSILRLSREWQAAMRARLRANNWFRD